MHYNDSQAVIKHGGSSGNVGEVVLEAGEFITIINGIVDGQIIAQLSFATNKGGLFNLKQSIRLNLFIARKNVRSFRTGAGAAYQPTLCLEGSSGRSGPVYGAALLHWWVVSITNQLLGRWKLRSLAMTISIIYRQHLLGIVLVVRSRRAM